MLRVRVEWPTTPSGAPYLSTHYFTGDDTQAGADAAVAAVGAFWGAVDANIHNTYSWRTSPIVDQLDTSGNLVGSFATSLQSGTGASSATDPLPFANQALVRWDTGDVANGRRILGRTFIPGLTEATSTNGLVSSTVRASINTAAAALINDIATELSVWSKTNASTHDVLTGTTNAQFAVLRSRRD